MLNSLFNYFISEDTVVAEPQVGIANIAFGNGFSASSRMTSRISQNKEAGTATYYHNDCEPVTVECDKVLSKTIVSDQAGCPSSFDAICRYEEGIYSKESGLKIEMPENKSLFQQSLEWLGIANLLDYNQDGCVSFDDVKDAANEHPFIAAALVVTAIPLTYIAGKNTLSATSEGVCASKDTAEPSTGSFNRQGAALTNK